MDRQLQRIIVVIAHNLRSVYNVGALLRTAEVFAARKVYVTGFTPHPSYPGDSREAKLQAQQTRQMAKAAAGAERLMPFAREPDVHALIDTLHEQDFAVAGLEIDPQAVALDGYRPPARIALLLGDEVRGIEEPLRQRCDLLLQIPMFGRKDSLNVSVAAGIALYSLRTS